MSITTHGQELPYHVQRIIRRYAPQMRAAIEKQLALKQAEHADRPLTIEEIGECAATVIFGESDYDKRMEQICIEAYDAGKSQSLQKVIDELRLRVSRPATVSRC